MSAFPPSSSGPPSNPDTRVLPEGWVTQFDSNHNAWYYVNTVQTPPEVTWSHPLGPRPPPPQQLYGPPAGPPPPNQGYGGAGHSYNSGLPSNGYGQSASGKGAKAGKSSGMFGGLLGGKLSGKIARSISGHGYSQGAGYGYNYAVPQPVYAQDSNQRTGGMGAPAGADAGPHVDLSAMALYEAGYNAGAATGYPRKNPADFI